MAHHIGLVVCENLVAEAEAVCRSCRWSDVSVRALPEHCDRAWASWEEVIDAAAGAGRADAFVVVGTACLPAGSPMAAAVPVCALRATSCAALLTNESLVEQWVRGGAYLATPGWLRGWRQQTAGWRPSGQPPCPPLGPDLTTLMLLHTGCGEAVDEELAACAADLGLEPVRQDVGIDVFGTRLSRAVVELRTSRQVEDAMVQTAETTMLLDLSAELMDIASEPEILAKVGELLRMLLPPCICRIASVRHGVVEHVSANIGGVSAAWFKAHLESRNALTMLTDDHGFVLQLRHRDDVVGIVEITRLSMPEYTGRYANAVMSIGGICAAAIVRCRALGGIIPICAGCKRIRGAAGWEAIDVYLREHSDVDFSHGLCPDCIKRLYPDMVTE